MPSPKKRLSIQDSKKVLALYKEIVIRFKWHSFWLVISGFALRAISIIIFVLILRIFMSIIEPSAGLQSINKLLLEYFGTTTTEKTMLLCLLGGLSGFILIQYMIGKLNLWLALTARRKILNFYLTHPLNEHRETHLHICIDHIPPGYDAVIKSLEILLFYIILLICIFYMSPLMGLAVLVAVPTVLGILLMKGRKEVFVVQEYRDARKTFQSDNDPNSLQKVIELSNQSFSYPYKDIINSQFSGSMAIVIIMATFMIFYDNFQYHGIAALLMVFSIRYSLIYAAELSRFLNRLLKQRTIIEKVKTGSHGYGKHE